MNERDDSIAVLATHVNNLVSALGPDGLAGIKSDLHELKVGFQRIAPFFEGENPLSQRVKMLEEQMKSIEKMKNYLILGVLSAIGVAVLNLVLKVHV